MKKSRKFSPRSVAVWLFGWLAFSNILMVLSHTTGWWPIKVVLFFCLSFLPGVALLRLLHIKPKSFSIGVLYSFGLSILVLMISGLFANQLLPIFGVQHPLEFWWILGVWMSVTACIIAACIITNHQTIHFKKWPKNAFAWPTWLLIGLSMMLPCLAVAGAFRLNNGGDGLFALITLGFAAALIIYTFLLRHRLSDGVIIWSIFILGLTILLMTSLRSWDIVGHDIEREYHVYTLTHVNALWNIGIFRDPYNACLSITILPEMFTRLLDVSGLVVFKVILQIIFAACPAVLYVLLRQYVPKLASLVGCILFISYPTFINDSAMLTRQGIAYLFFTLALLTLSNKPHDKWQKLLFLLCVLGTVFSHYSTSYMFVALFGGAVICKLIVTWWHKWRDRPLPHRLRHTILSPTFALLIFGMTFLWYSQITGTSTRLLPMLSQSFANIPAFFSKDNKSTDTSAALILSSNRTEADLYQSYLTSTKPRSTTTDAAAAEQFTPALISDSLPLTPLGEWARTIGFNPSAITALRQNFAKVLQALALLGALYATYKLLHRKPDILGPDFTCLSVAGIILLSLLVALPMLSINYGILRAFQQALIFLTLPIMLLLVSLSRHIPSRVITTLSTITMLLLFLLFTGVFTQLLGGASPSLSMNNQGIYYGLYYSSDADIRAFDWIKSHIPSNKDVRSANFNRAIMHTPNYPFSKSGLLPSQIRPDTYVYLDPAQVVAQRYYAYYNSSPLVVTSPLDYYESTANKLYSTTTTRIYQ